MPMQEMSVLYIFLKDEREFHQSLFEIALAEGTQEQLVDVSLAAPKFEIRLSAPLE